jgi:hypothetical protein
MALKRITKELTDLGRYVTRSFSMRRISIPSFGCPPRSGVGLSGALSDHNTAADIDIVIVEIPEMLSVNCSRCVRC